MTYEEAAKRVAAIVADLRSRRGLRQEWDEIDEATKDEIHAKWVEILVRPEKDESPRSR